MTSYSKTRNIYNLNIHIFAISVSYIMTATCTYLSTSHDPAKCDVIVSNCSRKMGYICQLFPSSLGLNNHTDSPSTSKTLFSSRSVSKEQTTAKRLAMESIKYLTQTARNTSSSPKTITHTQMNKHVKETTTHNSVVQPEKTSHYIPDSHSTEMCCAHYNLYCHNITKNPEQNLSHIIHELKVDKRTTSKHLRRLSSASDTRRSSKAMGIGAMLIICSIIACIVAMDIPHVVTFLKNPRY